MIRNNKFFVKKYDEDENKITLDFPFMIQDGTGLYFNEDYACYYGLGTCDVTYDEDADGNFRFENASFTELEK